MAINPVSQAAARTTILDRVRKALNGGTSTEAAEAHWHEIPRDFKQAATHAPVEILRLLKDRLIDYDAQVLEATHDTVATAITTLLTARGLHRLVIPQGLAPELLPPGFEYITDTGLTSSELDAFEGIITTATVAIAETGTVVLQNTPGQGRRAATLVPDYHLCIVHADNIVETVPEAIARLKPTASLATTFVSGPSATADIEMTRIKGVHGPRFLDVILVSEPG